MIGGFLALSLLLPSASPTGLQQGDQLTYTGTVEEAVERPDRRFRRSQKLEIRVLVLEVQELWTDVAVFILLRRTNDAVSGAVTDITGSTPERSPPLSRLDLVRVHADGSAHHLYPGGPPPLRFDTKTPARTLPPIPLDSFAPFEFGMFPPRPPQSARDKPWNVASSDPKRPAQTWQVQGKESVTGELCSLLVMNQRHPNWTKPVGGHSAWHRADAVWVSTLDGTARKVHRVIKHRDGIATELAAWVEVKYELKEQTRVIRKTFQSYRRDVETAYAASAEVAPFLPNAAKHGPRFFETRMRKLDAYLDGADESSPYREAVQAVRRQLDAARRGEVIAKASPVVLAPVGAIPTPKHAAWPKVGHIAPDFTAGIFRLTENRGKPALLIFFKPGSDTTPLTLTIANALRQRFASRASVVPLAVWGTPAAGAKERDRLKLTVPIYDGTQAETAYGIESVPRFVLVDATGRVRWAFAGVGAETGYSARRELDRLFPPSSPDAPAGTIRAPGTRSAPPRPRP